MSIQRNLTVGYRFTPVPVKVPRMSGSAHAVLNLMCQTADRATGMVRCSVRWLAERLNIAISTASEARSILERLGLIRGVGGQHFRLVFVSVRISEQHKDREKDKEGFHPRVRAREEVRMNAVFHRQGEVPEKTDLPAVPEHMSRRPPDEATVRQRLQDALREGCTAQEALRRAAAEPVEDGVTMAVLWLRAAGLSPRVAWSIARRYATDCIRKAIRHSEERRYGPGAIVAALRDGWHLPPPGGSRR